MLPLYSSVYKWNPITIKKEPDIQKSANLSLSEYKLLLITLQETEDMDIWRLTTIYELENSNTEETSEILYQLVTTKIDNLNNENFKNLWINIKTLISQQLQHKADKGK